MYPSVPCSCRPSVLFGFPQSISVCSALLLPSYRPNTDGRASCTGTTLQDDLAYNACNTHSILCVSHTPVSHCLYLSMLYLPMVYLGANLIHHVGIVTHSEGAGIMGSNHLSVLVRRPCTEQSSPLYRHLVQSHPVL